MDAKRYAACRQAELECLAIRQTISVTVLEASQGDPKFPPEPLPAFLDWVKGVQDLIPEDRLSTAKIEYGVEGDRDGSDYPTVKVTYQREETDEEWDARKAAAQARWTANEIERRQMYERLKQEFEQ